MGARIGWLDWACIGVYAAVLLGVAAYHSRKMKRQDDVFLAGRSMSSWPIALSMYMALFSTNTFLGVTGWVNRPDGSVWIGLQTFGIVGAVPIVVWLYPDLFFRLRITSAYEYLDRRFNASVRAVATAFFLAARLMWMSTMLYSASLVLSAMLGWTAPGAQLQAIALIGVMALLFALLGGMHAVIWTDVIQFFVLVAGLAGMTALGLEHAGGIAQVIRTGSQFGRFNPPSLFSLTDEMSVAGGLLLGFVGMLSSSGADQVVLQQYLTAKSAREAKASLWRNGLFLKPMSLIYPFLGLIIFAYYRAHPEVARYMRIPDDALPVFVVHVLPAGMRGLVIIAMIAAVLTSLESGLAAVSAAVQVNFVNARRKRPLEDTESVALARWLLFAFGVVIVAAACGVRALGERSSVIQILNVVMYPFSGVLLGIFLLGLLSRRANAPGVLLGGIAGFLATVVVPASRLLLPASLASGWLGSMGKISTFYFGFLGTIATVLAGYAASLAWPPPGAEKLSGLTRRPVTETRAGSVRVSDAPSGG